MTHVQWSPLYILIVSSIIAYTNSCEWAMYIECTAYNSLKSCVTSKWTQMTHVEYSPTGLGNSPNINNVPIGDLAKLHHEDW